MKHPINKLIEHNLIVQKYGGATLSTPEKIKAAARQIADLHRSGTQLVIVVSAMGQTTNDLIALAHQVSPRPNLRELDMLLTVGERISMSLMSMALNDLGCPAISFTGSQAGILTDESHVNANIIDVKATRVEQALQENKVVIMAGFQGVSPLTKEITTLGRGGSDTSAVAMAGHLKAARCEILKDVDSVYTADPKLVAEARPIRCLNYTQLLEMTNWGAKVLHNRSVEMAQSQNVLLYVGPAHQPTNAQTDHQTDHKVGTFIGDFSSTEASENFSQPRPLAVNSFKQVFAVELENDYLQFTQWLNQQQVPKPQLLVAQDKTHLISGPDETLQLLLEFEREKIQAPFKITNNNLSSVSLTFSQATSDHDFHQVEATLQKAGIKLSRYNFNLMNSVHCFVEDSARSLAVKTLHQLIN